MIAKHIRHLVAWHWALFFASVMFAWVCLFFMSHAASTQAFDLEVLRSLCTIEPSLLGALRLFFMWLLMSLAMMLPTLVPVLITYDDLGHQIEIAPLHLIAGFVLVWLGFSVLAALLQLGLYAMGWLDVEGQSINHFLSAFLLFVAGAYQFAPQKAACLAKCRQPLTFFFQHFAEGPFRNGLRLGAICVGCCWALMLLGFVGGMMNLAFMGLATVLMILEKWPRLGDVITRPLGAALVVIALLKALEL